MRSEPSKANKKPLLNRRMIAEKVVMRAEFLDSADRALLQAVFDRGITPAEIARAIGEPARNYAKTRTEACRASRFEPIPIRNATNKRLAALSAKSWGVRFPKRIITSRSITASRDVAAQSQT